MRSGEEKERLSRRRRRREREERVKKRKRERMGGDGEAHRIFAKGGEQWCREVLRKDEGEREERERDLFLLYGTAPLGIFKYLFKILNLPPVFLNF